MRRPLRRMRRHGSCRTDDLKAGRRREPAMVFVSVNPSSGEVEPYCDEAQRLLRALAPGVNVFLGETCLNATVHMSAGGTCWQSTPAVSGPLGKPAGMRDVLEVPRGATHIATHRVAHRWGAHALGHVETRVRRVPPPGNAPWIVQWQWCTEVDLKRARDRHWIAYGQDTAERLEERWRTGAARFAVDIEIGVRSYDVHVDRSVAFFRQIDTERRKQRWVRRVHVPEGVASERQASLRRSATDDICGICLDAFNETPALPRRTLPCAHVFHAACLQPLVDSGANCPLCRAQPFE